MGGKHWTDIALMLDRHWMDIWANIGQTLGGHLG